VHRVSRRAFNRLVVAESQYKQQPLGKVAAESMMATVFGLPAQEAKARSKLEGKTARPRLGADLDSAAASWSSVLGKVAAESQIPGRDLQPLGLRLRRAAVRSRQLRERRPLGPEQSERYAAPAKQGELQPNPGKQSRS
jgi:hypothetical protein